ncbi:MAG: alpha/beta fold hydrolase [Pseudomonadota bacterium]
MSGGVHWEVHGPEGAPPLLMVHGFLSSRAQWRANLDGLAGPFRVVLVELLGHGRSAAPRDRAAYEPAAYHAVFEAIRRELGAERWAVCGQSFGAALTLGYALDYPERVSAQVFCNSNAAFRDFASPEQLASTRARAGDIRAGGRAAIRAQPMHPANAKRFPEAVRAELAADAELIDPEGASLSLEITLPRAGVRERMRTNRTPVLMVNGRWEKKFQPHADWAERNVPRLRRTDLEGGHSINVEQAEAFDAAVIEFLTDRV